MTVRVLPPRVKATLLFASAVPVMATDCSAALTMSSTATLEIAGTLGAMVSMLMARVPVDETLPAASVAVAESVSLPCPMPVMSSGVSV